MAAFILGALFIINIINKESGDIPFLRQDEQGAVSRTAEVGAGIAAEVWTQTRHQTATQNAQAHWRKHGQEFSGVDNMSDYVAAARRFAAKPPEGTLVKNQKDGDTALYHPPSNTFLVTRPDGRIRTMFKPDSGRAYFDRQ